MTDSSTEDREKFDHSAHPTTHQVSDDLRGTGEDGTEKVKGDEGRMNDASNVDAHHFVDAASDSRSREIQIAELAHDRAQNRGFEPGHALDDWLAAEKEVDHAASIKQSLSDGIDDPPTPTVSQRPATKSLGAKTPDTSYVTTSGVRQA